MKGQRWLEQPRAGEVGRRDGTHGNTYERMCLICGLDVNTVIFHFQISTPRQPPDKSANVLLDLLRGLSSECVCVSGYGCLKNTGFNILT